MDTNFDITSEFDKIIRERNLNLKFPITTEFSKKKEVVDFLEMLIESTSVKNIFYDKENYLNIFYLTQIGDKYNGENKKGEYAKNIQLFIETEINKYKGKIRDIIDNKNRKISLDYDETLKKIGHILQKYNWFENYIENILNNN